MKVIGKVIYIVTGYSEKKDSFTRHISKIYKYESIKGHYDGFLNLISYRL